MVASVVATFAMVEVREQIGGGDEELNVSVFEAVDPIS